MSGNFSVIQLKSEQWVRHCLILCVECINYSVLSVSLSTNVTVYRVLPTKGDVLLIRWCQLKLAILVEPYHSMQGQNQSCETTCRSQLPGLCSIAMHVEGCDRLSSSVEFKADWAYITMFMLSYEHFNGNSKWSVMSCLSIIYVTLNEWSAEDVVWRPQVCMLLVPLFPLFD